MKEFFRAACGSGFRLTVFGIVALLLIMVFYEQSEKTIEANHEAHFKKRLASITQNAWDHYELGEAKPFVVKDKLITDASYQELWVDGMVKAWIVKATTQRSYSGDLVLAFAVTRERLLGLRVLKHQETPGLGDKIEAKKSPWVLQFTGVSLADREFDTITGATITSRGIITTLGELMDHAKLLSKSE